MTCFGNVVVLSVVVFYVSFKFCMFLIFSGFLCSCYFPLFCVCSLFEVVCVFVLFSCLFDTFVFLLLIRFVLLFVYLIVLISCSCSCYVQCVLIVFDRFLVINSFVVCSCSFQFVM